MSRENVELVRRLLDVYNERSFAENTGLIDPEIEWDFSRVELPEGTSYTGPSEFRSFIEAWEEGFESDHMAAQEIFDAGDRVVVVVHHHGRGKISRIEVEQTVAMLWTLRDGRAVRMAIYPTRAEALEAAGLSE
jgi:ketosteroid isomerase-like protein